MKITIPANGVNEERKQYGKSVVALRFFFWFVPAQNELAWRLWDNGCWARRASTFYNDPWL